jgi:hypothetical protein
LRTDVVLEPDAETVKNFDRYMAQTIVDQLSLDDNDERRVTGRLTVAQQSLQRGYHPYMLRFFVTHFIAPFGPLDPDAERVRALLKARHIGRLTRGERRLFDAGKAALLATERQRFSALSHHVELMAQQYVARGRMFAMPSGSPPEKAAEFTRDIYTAHDAGDYWTVRHLCELFDVLGVSSHVMYKDAPLDVYLYEKARRRSASFYYTLGAGLIAGPPPSGADMQRDHVFDYVVREQHTTAHALADDDDDGDGDTSHMPTDANYSAAWRRVTAFNCAVSSADFAKVKN